MNNKTTKYKETELHFWEDCAIYDEDYTLSDGEKTALEYIKKNRQQLAPAPQSSLFVYKPIRETKKEKTQRFGMTDFVLCIVLFSFILEAFISF